MLNNQIDDLLRARGQQHGSFDAVAITAQRIKMTLREGPSWNAMTWKQREALELIATKQARIVCGNPDEPDHWRDIGGYARLAERELQEGFPESL